MAYLRKPLDRPRRFECISTRSAATSRPPIRQRDEQTEAPPNDRELEELVLKESIVSATGLRSDSVQVGIKSDPSLRETAPIRAKYRNVMDDLFADIEPRLTDLLQNLPPVHRLQQRRDQDEFHLRPAARRDACGGEIRGPGLCGTALPDTSVRGQA